MTTNNLTAQVHSLFNPSETRYVVLMTNEQQTRVFDAREISLPEMIAILDANGLLPRTVAAKQADTQADQSAHRPQKSQGRT
jgi:hypothetical protein